MVRRFGVAASAGALAQAVLVLGPLAGAGAAFAAEPTAAPVATAPDQTDQQIAAWLADDGGAPDGPAQALAAAPDPGPRQVHGEASLTVGSRGLRAVSAAADIPIGEASDLGVAVSDAQWAHGGQARSLALSLQLRPDRAAASGPCGLHHSVPLPSDAAQTDRCAGAAAQ